MVVGDGHIQGMERPVPDWLKAVTVILFFGIMLAIGHFMEPVTMSLDRWMTEVFGLYGNLAITFAFFAWLGWYGWVRKS